MVSKGQFVGLDWTASAATQPSIIVIIALATVLGLAQYQYRTEQYKWKRRGEDVSFPRWPTFLSSLTCYEFGNLLCFVKDICCTCTELPIGIALWYK